MIARPGHDSKQVPQAMQSLVIRKNIPAVSLPPTLVCGDDLGPPLAGDHQA
jgi:hypothetical protein